MAEARAQVETNMKRGLLVIGWLLAGAFAGFGTWDGSSPMREALAGEAAGPKEVTSPDCSIKGTYPPAKGTKVFDQATGGNIIASLTGAYLPMTLSEIPFDPTTFRARLATSTGTGNLRIEGYVSVSDLPLYTAQDISVQGATIWISSAQRVKLVRATKTAITVELAVGGTLKQTVRATAPCEAFALAKGTPQRIELSPKGRSYMTKKEKVELYEQPNGKVVFTLNMMEGTGQLFWGDKVRQGFVHVISRNDLTIDAWVPLKDLEAIKKDEMMDQYVPPVMPVSGATLSFDKPPLVGRATRPIPIRAKRDESAKPVGVLETDAEFYILETVTTWTNVMPKHLGVLPPDDGGFWIPSVEVPK